MQVKYVITPGIDKIRYTFVLYEHVYIYKINSYLKVWNT